MWPEPSVSCLISWPLPGSHGQATFAPRALPREGPAEEENHFSRLASPGRSSHRKRGWGQHAQRSPPSEHSGSRPRDSGLSWGLRGHVP